MHGDFDEQEHLKGVAIDLCALAAEYQERKRIAVYPLNMDEVVIEDGHQSRTLQDRVLHRKLIDAIGGLLGTRWLLVDCQTFHVSLEEIETAKRVLNAMNP